MQRQRGELVPIGDGLSGMGGPVKVLCEASPQAIAPLHPTRSVMAMILKVRGLNVIIGDLMVAWPRNGTKLSRRPSVSACASCVPRRGFRRKLLLWTVVSTARISAALSAVNATLASSILRRSPQRSVFRSECCSDAHDKLGDTGFGLRAPAKAGWACVRRTDGIEADFACRCSESFKGGLEAVAAVWGI